MRKLTDPFRKLRGKSRLIISICLFGLVASVAAVIGAMVVHAFIGAQPAFELMRIDEPT